MMIVLEVNKRVGPRGTKSHWLYPLIIFVFHLKNVGDIFTFVKYCFLIVFQRGTKAHCVNPLPIYKHNYVNVIEKLSMHKIVVAIIIRQRDNKANFSQKY